MMMLDDLRKSLQEARADVAALIESPQGAAPMSAESILAEALSIVDERLEEKFRHPGGRNPTRQFSAYSASRNGKKGEFTVKRDLKTGSYKKYDVSGNKPRLVGKGGPNRKLAKSWGRAASTLKTIGASKAAGNNRINTKALRTSRVTAGNTNRVKVFQSKHGLKVDGVLGPKTAAKLRSVRKARRTTSF